MSFSRMDEKEKQQALEEEQARLQALKVRDFFFFFFDRSPLNQGVRVSAVAAEMPAGLVVRAAPLSSPLTLIQVALSCVQSPSCSWVYQVSAYSLRSAFGYVQVPSHTHLTVLTQHLSSPPMGINPT